MNKKKTTFIFLIAMFFISAVTFVTTYKLHDTIKSQKDNLLNKNLITSMRENIDKISSLNSLEDEADAWYTKYHFVSHAGGV